MLKNSNFFKTFSREFKFVKVEENMNPKLRRKRNFFSQIIILLQGSYTGLKETDNPSNTYHRFHCSKKFKNVYSSLAASWSLVAKQCKKYSFIFFRLFVIFNHQNLLFKANEFLKGFKHVLIPLPEWTTVSYMWCNKLFYIFICSVSSYMKVHDE